MDVILFRQKLRRINLLLSFHLTMKIISVMNRCAVATIAVTAVTAAAAAIVAPIQWASSPISLLIALRIPEVIYVLTAIIIIYIWLEIYHLLRWNMTIFTFIWFEMLAIFLCTLYAAPGCKSVICKRCRDDLNTAVTLNKFSNSI